MALHVASGLGISAIVRKLIQRGHNVNAHDGSGWTPLQNAAFYGHTKVAKELIRAKADVHLKVKRPGRNVLRIAAYYIFRIMMKIGVLCSRLTLDAGVGIDEQDCFFESRTALMLAAQRGHSAVVAELVKAGADVNVKDRNGMTAVLLARNYDVIHQLWIQHAGGVTHLSKEDRSRILWHACDKGDLSMIQSLIKAGCDVDHVHKGQTLVMMATLRGHDRIVKELILANCDVNQHSKGYYSDVRSSLSLGRQFLPSAMIGIAIMVLWFALLLELGQPPLVVPPWVNAWTGSVALLAAPVCATAAALLPVSWPAVLIWVAVVARVVMMMVVVAAMAGPVVWITAAAIATVGLLWAVELRATQAAIFKYLTYNAKDYVTGFVAFVVWSVIMTVAAGALMIVIFLLAGPEWLVSFVNIYIEFFVLFIPFVSMSVSTIYVMVKEREREKLITGMLILFLCIFCIKGPTWLLIEQVTYMYNQLVFHFLVWMVGSKAPDATALHYAAGHNHIKCGGLLVEAGADLSARNKTYRAPLMIGSNRLEDEVEKTQYFTAKRTIAVIGNEECGKSTLIAALVVEREFWLMKVINYFRKVHDIKQRTTGIYPISQKYGETLFYDFAGQSQYHGPHQSFLEAMMNKLGVSVTLLILVKATERKDTITQQLYRWLLPLAQTSAPSTPLAIVVGSFFDHINGTDKKKEASAKLQQCTEIVRKNVPLKLRGPHLLDCRRPESGGMNQIRALLRKVQAMQLSTKSLPYNLHWVLVQVRKAFSTPAVRLHEFQNWLQVTSRNLPRNLPSPKELCQDLSGTGRTLFIPNKQDPSHSWLIVDLPSILHDVYGTLFSGSQGKVNQFGLLHTSQLAELFPELDLTLIQEVLTNLEFCIKIDPVLLHKELAKLTNDRGREGWLYFPALVSAQPCKSFPKDPDPDQFQWMCWQLRTAEKHFVSPHLLQTIILRLAANHVFTHELSPSVREHCCSVWVNGISWRSTKGVDIAVQISDDNSVVQVIGRSQEGSKRLHQYTSIIARDIIRTTVQLSPHMDSIPYIVHPYTPTLWANPQAAQPDSLYPVSSILHCISNSDEYVLSLPREDGSYPQQISLLKLFGWSPSLSLVQDMAFREASNSAGECMQ